MELVQDPQEKEVQADSLNLKSEEKGGLSAMQEDAYGEQSLAYYPQPRPGYPHPGYPVPGYPSPGYPVPGNPLPRVDLVQEGRFLGQLLDSGNFQFAAQRLQADLIQLRPNRQLQNMLLNQVNIYDRKGIGSDLSLGYYNPYNSSYSHGYIIPSIYRPYPTYPVYY